MPELTRRRARWILAALVLAATALRLALGRCYYGFHTGDDVEILQAAFLRALGWPYLPWDIRNLLVSDLVVAPFVALASALGVRSTAALLWIASAPMVLCASLNVWLVFRLAARWLESERAALLAAALYAFHWLPLGYGSMVYPRTVSTSCVLAAALLLWEGESRREWRAALAGALMAVAWAMRYSEAIFLLPLFALIWLRERDARARLLRSCALAAGFAAMSLLTVGLQDWLTWGKPFASLTAAVRYTLFERRSSALVPETPWHWYLWRLPKWLAPTLLPLLWRARKVPGALPIALFVTLPLAGLSLIHQKQLRYLQGVIPFLVVLAAAGAWSWWQQQDRRKLVAALAIASLLLGLGGITFLRKKSMAAVLAAQDLARSAQGTTVCLSQPWAYGSTLYLGSGVDVRELPYPLPLRAFRRGIDDCAVVALYREDHRRDPRIGRLLARRGFAASAEYRVARSKPVLVFRRRLAGKG